MFLANLPSNMKRGTAMGSRLAEVHNAGPV